MSPQLQQFVNELAAHLFDEGPRLKWFNPLLGLCSHAIQFGGYELNQELEDLFAEEGLNPSFPFDKNPRDYLGSHDLYLNPARLAWIKAHAQCPNCFGAREFTYFNNHDEREYEVCRECDGTGRRV